MLALPPPPVTKVCLYCQKAKPLDAFLRRKNASDGRYGHCRDCRREYERERCGSKARKPRGMNVYRIDGETTYCQVVSRTGLAEFIIDTADLQKLLSLNKRWCINKSGYVRTSWHLNYRGKALLLHRFLLAPPDDLVVDHINENTLDNRRSNLEVVTAQENVRRRWANERKRRGQ